MLPLLCISIHIKYIQPSSLQLTPIFTRDTLLYYQQSVFYHNANTFQYIYRQVQFKGRHLFRHISHGDILFLVSFYFCIFHGHCCFHGNRTFSGQWFFWMYFTRTLFTFMRQVKQILHNVLLFLNINLVNDLLLEQFAPKDCV